ncbi:MAG: Unknown protein [uncultured Sulfurovum sp.]|uniref:Uncharacterized protein n=1 Tax=uncultured Sulfurovum sp. TaxID=269237 RepID=A0A6S6SHJ9_9BACT|nr:MAG: Unknown protein [uncultured Sulfurovum sp.]
MKRLLPLILLPILSYAGSAPAVIECSSGSGRTVLTFDDYDLQAQFSGGTLSIDNKKVKYSSEYGHIISDFRRGIYVLYYKNSKDKTALDFYAIPKTIKRIDSNPYETAYKFEAVIGPNSTDPRQKSKILNKTIWLSCTLKYSV